MALTKFTDSAGREAYKDASGRVYTEGGKRDTYYNVDQWNARQASKSSGGGSSSKSSNSDLIEKAIKLNREAVKPAISSYQASLPEVANKYNSQRDTLSQKYDSLLASIKGNQTTAENRQTVATNNELGKRGILGSSGLAQQELVNAVNPITAQYTGLYSDAALQKIADINATYTNQTAEERAIKNAIAALQSGAGQTGLTQGINWENTTSAAAAAQKQKDFENRLLELTTNYNINKPYYKGESTDDGY